MKTLFGAFIFLFAMGAASCSKQPNEPKNSTGTVTIESQTDGVTAVDHASGLQLSAPDTSEKINDSTEYALHCAAHVALNYCLPIPTDFEDVISRAAQTYCSCALHGVSDANGKKMRKCLFTTKMKLRIGANMLYQKAVCAVQQAVD